MLTTLLITLNVLVCIALIGVVLLQRSEGGAFGMGGGPTGLITARGAGDLLTRTTWVLFGLFLVLSLGLTLLGAHDRATSSVIEKLKLQQANPNALNAPTNAIAAPAPGATNAAASPFLAPPPASATPAAAAPAPAAPPTTAPASTAVAPTPAKPTPAAHATPPKPAPTHAAAAPAPAAATPAPPVLEAPPPAPAPTPAKPATETPAPAPTQ